MVLPPPLPLPLLLLVITYMEESGGRGKGLSSLRGGGGKAMEAASAEAAEAEATAEGGGDTSFPFYMPGARAGGGEAYPPQRHGWRWRRTCGILNQARLSPPLVPCSFLETGRNGEAGEGGGGDAKICGRRRSDAALN